MLWGRIDTFAMVCSNFILSGFDDIFGENAEWRVMCGE